MGPRKHRKGSVGGKQRFSRRQRELEAELAHQEAVGRNIHTVPRWYKQVADEFNGDKMIHVYKGGYWEAKQKQDWSKCPDIFELK